MYDTDSTHSSISLNATLSEDVTSIKLSWTLVNSSFVFRSYAVKYTACDIWSGQCDATVSSTDITNTYYNLDSVNIWKTYNFTVLAYFNSMDMSEHVLPLSSGVHIVTTQGMLQTFM